MLTCKITWLDSPHPVIISVNAGCRALYLASQNGFRFFRLINNLAFARKMMVLPESGGLQPSSPLARTPMYAIITVQLLVHFEKCAVKFKY